MEWLTEHKLPIGKWAKWGVDWLTDNASGFFDAISVAIEWLIDSVLWVLQAPHPLGIVVIATALAFVVRRSFVFSAFVAVSLLLIINQGYWDETTETLALILSSTFICMLIGIPVGVYSAHHPKFFSWVRPVLDLMQTIPTFVYLIPALILFGLGVVPGLISTVVFALPASIRLTQIGVASTPLHLLEAGEAFGATYWQKLFKIELPYALPNIMAGLTQTIMLSLSMVVIAALVGADGLGVPTLRALNTVNIAKGFEVGIAIVLIAIVLDRFFKSSEEKGSKK
ncbi:MULTISPECIES: choline ABC transporter permease subunit [Pseudovibrio]|uniref:Glycine betaine/proline transport system permease protein n=1 Tax=Pseudovibrio ascidiaceicola TaxID=285279 RepID=A0A1I3VKK1_9HYPH|nr:MULTISPECIES: choline ABC transporter permease subunit [Pseudovibrio]KZL16368.1 Glycine betaine transport system permease protein OpuAB [Pseudovibrio sp. Ad26]KZL24721.1 Glycine betaine transport system permease protein OpuAB [Pseudovibrio sp. WM33]SFJ95513.1 glycine betaine/proline transport system permease protein [Pseudovibrio ascidiaceicola]